MDEKHNIKVRAILEIMGTPREHVDKTMDMVIGKVKECKSIEIFDSKLHDSKEVEGKPFWSKFTEFELGFNNEEDIFGFCFDFMPSSLEILEPSKFSFDKDILEGMYNDLLARLHQYDMMLKNIHSQNLVMKKELEKLGVGKSQPQTSEKKPNEKADKK
tara:strand:- start:11429 stop:11905 length:477 start_codon:yes stop_codon:yes gene_type:complete